MSRNRQNISNTALSGLQCQIDDLIRRRIVDILEGEGIKIDKTNPRTPVISAITPYHNKLKQLQGGKTGEYFHLDKMLYDTLKNISQDNVDDWMSAYEDVITSAEFTATLLKLIQRDGGEIEIPVPIFNQDTTGSAGSLTTARRINGTLFNGSQDIVTNTWGTPRNITIGNTSKVVNGSTNVSWSLAEIGASSSDHTHTFASLTQKPTTLLGYGITDVYDKASIENFFNGNIAIPGYNKAAWDSTSANSHTHSNKTVLDSITSTNVSNWNTAYSWGDHAGLYAPVNHTHSFAQITSKPTTILGYGITDAYTKTEVDAKVSSVYKVKGSVASFSALPTTGNVEGDVYNTLDSGKNYAWVLNLDNTGQPGWDDIGGLMDLSSYASQSWVSTNFIPTTHVVNGITSTNISNWNTAFTNSHTHANKAILDATTASYTTAEKTKLAGIQDGAEVNVQADWNQTNTALDDYIKNKPNVSLVGHTHTFAEITSKPTTLSGYGITNAVPSNRILTINGVSYDLSADRAWNISVGGGGSVTSVGMTVPTGLTISGSPITTSGTLALGFASGYSIPTDSKQAQWDGAVANSHTHTNKTVLDGITSAKVSNWDTAYSWGNHAGLYAPVNHTHTIAQVTNLQTTLDGKQATLVSGTNIKTVNGQSLLGSGDIAISGGGGGSVTSVGLSMPTGFTVTNSPVTGSGTLTVALTAGYVLPTTSQVSNWDTAVANSHTHANKTVLDGITATNVSNWNTAFTWGNHAGLYVDLTSNQTIGGVKTFTQNVTAPAFYESSLRSLKTNIEPFEKSGLDLINELEIVTFDRKDGSAINKIGIIADDSPKEFLSENLDAVDLYKTIFVQAKAIQELREEIENLKAIIYKTM